MKKYVVFDPSYVTDNLGDFIIMDAINEALSEVLPEDYFFHIPSNDFMGPEALSQLKKAPMSFVGGTNMLTSHWWWYRQWNLRLTETFKVHDAVLVGVGWHKYQRVPDPITRWVYRRILSSTVMHSVRDKYTQSHLNKIGFNNVIYTGCPTMWRLTPDHCAAVSVQKSRAALVTLTAYLAQPEVDKAWLRTVFKHYDEVYFWSQMHDDHDYAMKLAQEAGFKFKLISPTLERYNQTLRDVDLDFIGTRLHGGIRALQYKRRALILAVDNRAAEIGKDTRLHVVPREDVNAIERWIHNPRALELAMPFDNIEKWKRQFRKQP